MRRGQHLLLLVSLVGLLALVATAGAARLAPAGRVARIAYVIGGDTIELTNGERVRLVQIDTPEGDAAPGRRGTRTTASPQVHPGPRRDRVRARKARWTPV
jgi:endonuclease YncB( thermonuclease family)